MDKIRDFLKGRQQPAQPQRPVSRPPVHETTDGRADRAGHVDVMRADVSRLQQEILVLSRTDQGAAAKQSQMSVLEHQLDTAQRELAKVQGRV